MEYYTKMPVRRKNLSFWAKSLYNKYSLKKKVALFLRMKIRQPFCITTPIIAKKSYQTVGKASEIQTVKITGRHH